MMTQPTCTLRQAEPADLASVFQIEQSASAHPWSMDVVTKTFARSQCAFWVAEVDSQVVGFAAVERVDDEATLLNFVVARSHQSLGIGRRLLVHVIGQLQQRVNRLFLEVRVSNFQAIALYLSSGFREIGRRENYYPAPLGREDALVLLKVLDPLE